MHTPLPAPAFDVAALIDGQPIGAFQRRILWLIGCALVMDGFDVQAMGFVAPAIVRDWGVARSALGPVFAASLVGMLIGSLVFSAIADRRGRRPVLIGSTLLFAVLMFATAFAHNLQQLLVLRLLTGFGLGGVMANAVALAGEYSPARRRASIMIWVSCGFTAGGMLGGLVSSVAIPLAGWWSVFIIGGAVPLALGLAMVKMAPESVQWLAARGRSPERIAHWLRRVVPQAEVPVHARFVAGAGKAAEAGNSSIGELFRAGRAATTLLLWVVNFMNLLNLFFLANWLPTIAADAGYSTQAAVLIGTLLQGGGVVGTLVMGPLVDRFGFYRVLVPTFSVGVIAIAAIGQPALPAVLLISAVAVAGYCVVGAQPALNALAGAIYPTAIRATGMGWSLGIGRAGSIVGPVVAGHLIGQQWGTDSLFLAAAVPALISAVFLACIGQLARKGSRR